MPNDFEQDAFLDGLLRSGNLASATKEVYAVYAALVDAGFTENQAMELIINCITTLLLRE